MAGIFLYKLFHKFKTLFNIYILYFNNLWELLINGIRNKDSNLKMNVPFYAQKCEIVGQ